MKRKILIVATALLMTFGAKAQDEITLDSPTLDGFNFSYMGLYGTASYVGRAGAIGALGGDFTAASYNPAGLGVFYSSRMSITPVIDYAGTQSEYMGLKTTASRTTFKIGSFEILLAMPITSSENGWRSFQMGIGMNRLKSFNGRSYVKGNPILYSMLDSWTNYANDWGLYPDELDAFSSRLAFNTYLMDTLSGGNRHINNFLEAGEQVRQERDRITTGGISEIPISFSGNYGDKLYVGATIGIPILSYNHSSTYRETSETTGNYFDYTENYEVSGTGINFKFGAIYRPIEMLRIGLAVHTPTLYDIKDVYNTSIYNSSNNRSSSSVESEGGYNFRTPMKVIASVGATFGNQSSSIAGSIDVDYEYSNYKNMSFRPLGDNFTDMDYERWRNELNYQIESTYRSGHTLRVGGSLNVRHWVLRAGMAYFSNAYKEFDNVEFKNAQSLSLACGFGYQTRHFFWDFAYAHSVSKDYEGFIECPEMIHANNFSNLYMTTLGFKF